MNSKTIYYGKQFINNEDIKFVKKSLKQKLITTGNSVKKFEKNISKYTGSKYAVCCNNGTAALHMSLFAINLKPKEIIIMPSVNFISSYAMAKNMNAKVFLTDVCPITGMMRIDDLVKCIKENKLKKIKSVINMYIGGSAKNIEEFYNLKKKYNFFLIEDACHAFGTSYLIDKIKYKIGSCVHSDICTFSFHPLKSITTGEGGCVTTNNFNFAKRMQIFRSHGIVKRSYYDYDIKELGYNYRLSDVNCALGISQLKKLNLFVQRRREIAKIYIKSLKNFEKFIQIPTYDPYSSWHLFRIRIKTKKNDLIKFLQKNGVYCQIHYKPINKFNFFKSKVKFKNSEIYFRHALSLPIYYNLTKQEIFKVCNLLKKYFLKNY